MNGMTGRWATITCIVFAWSFGEARSVEQNQLFEMTSVESEGLQGRQDVEEMFEAILDRPKTMTVDVIRMNGDLVSSLTSRVLLVGERIALEMDDIPVVVPLPSGHRMELDRFHIKKTGTLTYFFHGSDTGDWTSSLSLTVHDGKLLGNIDFGHEQYFVGFLEGDLHLLVRFDSSRFPNEAPPLDP